MYLELERTIIFASAPAITYNTLNRPSHTYDHHAAAFTLDVYGHVTDKMKRDSAARMDTFIKGVQGYKNL